MKLKSFALCAAVAGVAAHSVSEFDPFDNSDLGLVVSTWYRNAELYCEHEDNFRCRSYSWYRDVQFTQAIIDQCKEQIPKGRGSMNQVFCHDPNTRGHVPISDDNISEGFMLGKSIIQSFRLSGENSHFNKDLETSPWSKSESFLGIIVYEVGTCPLRACHNMRNGYVMIFHQDKFARVPNDEDDPKKNTPHNKAVFWFFGVYPEELRKKYGMRFSAFSIRSDGFRFLYGSSTYNEAVFRNYASYGNQDKMTDAYELAIMYMLTDKWKAQTGGTTIRFNDAQRFFRKRMSNILEYLEFLPYYDTGKSWYPITQEEVFKKEFEGFGYV